MSLKVVYANIWDCVYRDATLFEVERAWINPLNDAETSNHSDGRYWETATGTALASIQLIQENDDGDIIDTLTLGYIDLGKIVEEPKKASESDRDSTLAEIGDKAQNALKAYQKLRSAELSLLNELIEIAKMVDTYILDGVTEIQCDNCGKMFTPKHALCEDCAAVVKTE